MFSTLMEHFAGLSGWQLGLIATGLLWQGAIFSPFPEEVVLITLGILWGQGRISFGEALFFNCLGLVPSNWLPVFLGRRFGARLLARRPFSWMVDARSLEGSLERLRGKSDWIIFVTRFTPFVRGPIYFAAGLAKMSYTRFLVVDTIAAAVQCAAIQWAGKKMGDNSESVLVAYQRVGILMLVLLAGGAVWAYVKRPRPAPLEVR